MLLRLITVLVIAAVNSFGQSSCPEPNFLTARTVNFKPSATSHIDAVRQADGSYTGFEVTDEAPDLALSVTEHLERQFAACLPHTLPADPSLTPPVANPPGAGSQLQVEEPVAAGDYFVGKISADTTTIYFDIFDAQHNLVSETAFTLPLPNPFYGQTAQFLSLALADLNHDGNADLIAVFSSPLGNTNSHSGGVWTFLGNGDGTFQAGKSQTFTSAGGNFLPVLSVSVGDINGDGKPDLVLPPPAAPVGAPILIAFGNGDGTFSAQTSTVQFPEALEGGEGSVALADLNGDGKMDIVMMPAQTPTGAPAVAVILGNGDGTFQTASVYQTLPLLPGTTTAAPSLAAVAVGDVNGDGVPDIVTSSGTILFGNGVGGFSSRADYAVTNPASVMLADLDGDGITDVIIGNGNPAWLSGNTTDPSLTVLFGAGGGAFTGAPVSGVTFTQNAAKFVAADLNGDGIPDLAMINSLSNNTVQVQPLQNTGNGVFQPFGLAQTLAIYGPTYAIAADFNHDGKSDVAVLATSDDGVVVISLGNGSGTFATPLTLPIGDTSVNFMAAPDLNGDGIPDLVVTSGTSIYAWLGKGDGTFSGPSFTFNVDNPAVSFSDFNGDGKIDMVVSGAGSSTMSMLLGKGDGTFAAPITTPLPLPALGFVKDIAAADFDGNGLPDVAVVLAAPGNGVSEIAVFPGRGDGTFQSPQVTPANITSLIAVDMNGDKVPDLASHGVNGVAACLGNGDGTFQPCVAISGPVPQFVVADLNGDGMPDVATLSTQGITAYLNLSRPAPPLTVVSAASFAAGALAPGSIATAFGEGFLSRSGVASNPPQTSIGPITVSVQDSAGISRPAPLYFTSYGQINFVVPAESALGPANVTVNGASSGAQPTAQIQIAAIAPALFSVGSGIAAAYTVQGGTIDLVYSDLSGTVMPAPIDLSQPGQVYLVLFGTGFDAATAGATSASVQGVTVPVTYSGPQPMYLGLDQINLALPASLGGTGVASVSVSIGGQMSNIVYVTIQ